MPLTRVEKERIIDGRLKLQSVTKSLKHVDSSKVEGMEAIEECLEAAEHSLKSAIRSAD